MEDKVYTLKNDIEEVNIILENISKSIDKVPSMWKSPKEEEIMSSLSETTKDFDYISSTNGKYLELLDLVAKGEYDALDKKIDELMHDEIAIN